MTDRPPEATFIPIAPNPYIVGNPVRGRAMFFGREAEFEMVRRRFQDSTHGGLLVFCGERRSGKTSILFQILDGRLGPVFIPVLIDMQSMAVGSEGEFLARVSEELLAALGPGAAGIEAPRFTAGTNHSATFQRFVRDVLRSRPEKKLILLFDEYELFENKIEAGSLSEDVLHVLAGLMESQPVFMVFTGSQHLDQRRREYWKILGKSLHKMISFLEREDALNLVRQPVEGRVHYAADAVEAIWRLAAGQPFYTQAICQSLVDHLNDRRTVEAARQNVMEVVDSIVNNPLPQMIFLWDGLERDEKLVLALLAERLADEDAHGRTDDLVRLLRQRDYPLSLDKALIATTLEKLFKTEMLVRSDRAHAHEYAFRMDLWRLWIRRQHSVWQVMREEGLEIRKAGGRRARTTAGMLMGAAFAVLLLVLWLWRDMRPRDGRSSVPAGKPVASLALEVDPAHAAISLDGQQVGFGAYRGMITAVEDHRLHLSAAGFADTDVVMSVAPGDSSRRRVTLRELLGRLRLETRPPGAEVSVDGRVAGTSPLTVSGLSAAKAHRVEARLAGYGEMRQEVNVGPDTEVSAILVLKAAEAQVLVTTEPSGSEIRVDGGPQGRSPISLADVSLGPHAFSASREGYLSAETSLVVARDTRRVHLGLTPEPPGFLVVQGDRPAEIWVDGVLVVAHVQNSGPRSLPSGTHGVRVILQDGAAIESTIVVKSRERATYDYSRGTVARLPERKP